MTVDSTFEFEQRRNTPIRYNRDTVVETIAAIKRVSEIREARQKRFWENRVRKAQERHKDANVREIEKSIHLIDDPAMKDMITLRLTNKMNVESN